MFERIFIEQDMLHHHRVHNFLNRFPNIPTQTIPSISEVFNRKKKPYLQKRANLQAFLGKNRGTLIKEAPDAYGVQGEPHYYFIHSYNCIYECQYCYLQGYFHSPDLVFFLNYEEMMQEIESKTLAHPEADRVWFHAGEFSDSLALSHLTGEVEVYHELLKRSPRTFLELRTKSVNIRELLSLEPLDNLITTFSLAPFDQVKIYDLKTPGLKARLEAMNRLQQAGHTLGLHLDPIIYTPDFEAQFKEFFQQLKDAIDLSQLSYVSLGVVRFTKDVYHQVEKNYPESPLLKAHFSKSFDNKIRYSRPLRLWMLGKIQDLALQAGLTPAQMYLCMEESDRILQDSASGQSLHE
jgi:spore photoproduct lyase